MRTDERGFRFANIATRDVVLGNLWNTGQIHAVPLMVIDEIIDRKTGESYCDSPYSVIFNETQYEASDFQIVSYVWTTHPIYL